MTRRDFAILSLPLIVALFLAGCSGGKGDPQAEAPPPLKVERVEDRSVFQVDHPERFQLTQATEHVATPQLKVTGTVNPDISRAVPVISIAAGRVVEIDARLGDTVKKGQLLLKVQRLASSLEIIGHLFGYAQATNTRALALVGDADANAYELLFSFASSEGKEQFLHLVRTNDDMENDYIENDFMSPTAEEIRNARPFGTVLPPDVVNHVAQLHSATARDLPLPESQLKP
jgi:hypothetical protein